jgi:hypothetical protein
MSGFGTFPASEANTALSAVEVKAVWQGRHKNLSLFLKFLHHYCFPRISMGKLQGSIKTRSPIFHEDDWVVELVTLNQRVPGSSPGAPTIQSYRTTNPRADSEQAVSWGIFASIVALVRSPVTPAVSQADFSLPSLHPKIPFPAAGF